MSSWPQAQLLCTKPLPVKDDPKLLDDERSNKDVTEISKLISALKIHKLDSLVAPSKCFDLINRIQESSAAALACRLGAIEALLNLALYYVFVPRVVESSLNGIWKLIRYHQPGRSRLSSNEAASIISCILCNNVLYDNIRRTGVKLIVEAVVNEKTSALSYASRFAGKLLRRCRSVEGGKTDSDTMDAEIRLLELEMTDEPHSARSSLLSDIYQYDGHHKNAIPESDMELNPVIDIYYDNVSCLRHLDWLSGSKVSRFYLSYSLTYVLNQFSIRHPPIWPASAGEHSIALLLATLEANLTDLELVALGIRTIGNFATDHDLCQVLCRTNTLSFIHQVFSTMEEHQDLCLWTMATMAEGRDELQKNLVTMGMMSPLVELLKIEDDPRLLSSLYLLASMVVGNDYVQTIVCEPPQNLHIAVFKIMERYMYDANIQQQAMAFMSDISTSKINRLILAEEPLRAVVPKVMAAHPNDECIQAHANLFFSNLEDTSGIKGAVKKKNLPRHSVRRPVQKPSEEPRPPRPVPNSNSRPGTPIKINTNSETDIYRKSLTNSTMLLDNEITNSLKLSDPINPELSKIDVNEKPNIAIASLANISEANLAIRSGGLSNWMNLQNHKAQWIQSHTKLQAEWLRRLLKIVSDNMETPPTFGPNLYSKVRSATKIQAAWRGHKLRTQFPYSIKRFLKILKYEKEFRHRIEIEHKKEWLNITGHMAFEAQQRLVQLEGIVEGLVRPRRDNAFFLPFVQSKARPHHLPPIAADGTYRKGSYELTRDSIWQHIGYTKNADGSLLYKNPQSNKSLRSSTLSNTPTRMTIEQMKWHADRLALELTAIDDQIRSISCERISRVDNPRQLIDLLTQLEPK